MPAAVVDVELEDVVRDQDAAVTIGHGADDPGETPRLVPLRPAFDRAKDGQREARSGGEDGAFRRSLLALRPESRQAVGYPGVRGHARVEDPAGVIDRHERGDPVPEV